jgi:hypothetical protein
LLKESVLWIFIGLYAVGLIIRYVPLISRYKNFDIPTYIFWAIPLLGVYIASFQVYKKGIGEYNKTIKINERDLETFNELSEMLPSHTTMAWIRDYDFGGAIDFDRLHDLKVFYERCRDPDFEFINREMENLKLQLFEHIDTLLSQIGQETFPIQIPNRNLNRIPYDIGDER